ncbi:MAG TPA: hypothetical protein VGM18_13655 [Candidatus Sulfotelmatobacter sp.]
MHGRFAGMGGVERFVPLAGESQFQLALADDHGSGNSYVDLGFLVDFESVSFDGSAGARLAGPDWAGCADASAARDVDRPGLVIVIVVPGLRGGGRGLGGAGGGVADLFGGGVADWP